MRIRKIWFTMLVLCCSILFFVACKKERLVQSISLNEYSSEKPLEFTIGNFSYDDYTVSITYDDGETEEMTLTEDMIPETDKLKFYQEGRNTITITYEGVETSVEIKVSRNVFSDNIQLNGFTETYTGENFIAEVEGDLPGGTKILYPQGNTFTNAGSYDMTAILQCDGYVTKTLSARVNIEKATYDVTNAQLYDETFVYDKDAHGLVVKGQAVEDENGTVLHAPVMLPQGVSVSYSITKVKNGKGENIAADKQQLIEGNKAVEAGTYQVCAQFKGDEGNYNAIPDSFAFLTIERAVYDLSKIQFVDKTVTYSGETQALHIAENSKLPESVTVSYQIKQLKDGAHETVSDTYKTGNSAINAGMYLVKASFSVNGKNAENYTTAPLDKEAYLIINRASYDEGMKNLYLDTQWETFIENKTYEICLEGELPQGVSPQFTLTSEQGETIQGEMKTVVDETTKKTSYQYLFSVESMGEYTCTLTFIHHNENYDTITLTLNATIYISSAV